MPWNDIEMCNNWPDEKDVVVPIVKVLHGELHARLDAASLYRFDGFGIAVVGAAVTVTVSGSIVKSLQCITIWLVPAVCTTTSIFTSPSNVNSLSPERCGVR